MLETILVKRKKISRETYRDSNMDLCHEQLQVARLCPYMLELHRHMNNDSGMFFR